MIGDIKASNKNYMQVLLRSDTPSYIYALLRIYLLTIICLLIDYVYIILYTDIHMLHDAACHSDAGSENLIRSYT